MNENTIPLNLLKPDEKGLVKDILVNGLIRRRLLDLGLINETIVESLYKSPFGDPTAFLIRGAVIALRSDISSHILIEKI